MQLAHWPTQAIVAQLGFPTLPSPISIETQGNTFISSSISTLKPPACTRVTFIAGGDNDFGAVFAAYQANPVPAEELPQFIAAAAQSIATCIFNNVNALFAAGEQNIVIVTPLDASKTPFVAKQGPDALQFATALAAAYNQALLAGVQQLQAALGSEQPGFKQDQIGSKGRKHGGHGRKHGDEQDCCKAQQKTLQVLDLYTLFTNLFADPNALEFETGASDVVNPCIVTAADGTIVSVCDDPENRFWWDDLHVTQGVYEYIGQIVYDNILDN